MFLNSDSPRHDFSSFQFRESKQNTDRTVVQHDRRVLSISQSLRRLISSFCSLLQRNEHCWPSLPTITTPPNFQMWLSPFHDGRKSTSFPPLQPHMPCTTEQQKYAQRYIECRFAHIRCKEMSSASTLYRPGDSISIVRSKSDEAIVVEKRHPPVSDFTIRTIYLID